MLTPPPRPLFGAGLDTRSARASPGPAEQGINEVWCYGSPSPHSRLARRGRSRRAAICARSEVGACGVTTSLGLRRPSLGDDVAAWLLSYGAVLEAVIAIATLPLPRSTPPRRAGEGAPGGGHYKDVTGRGAAAAPALRRLASDTAATGVARAGAQATSAHAMWAWREPRRAEGGRAKCARSNLCCCTAAAPWISRSACYQFRAASPLLALSVAAGVVGAVKSV